MKTTFTACVVYGAFLAGALAQTTYPDGAEEVAVPGGPFPHLDITSVEVSASIATSQITFKVFVSGDPTIPPNADWGNYMIAVKSGPGGDTTETGWARRPISFPSGMTHWVGTWNTGGQIWTYGASWAQTGSVTPVKDGAQRSITMTMPFSALALSAGETITFDVYSSGGTETDGAVDALSVATSTITEWNQQFNSDEPLAFTMPTSSDSEPDGLPDAWEIANFEDLLETATGDPDGDLLDNAGEYARSTNPNVADTDTDGLSDRVEDNSGVYAGAASPGTSAVDADTDNDGHLDGAEAAGTTALGFESNPLRKNYAVMAVPGTFNAWNETGTATPSNAMTRAGTSLTAQYQYTLDYQFTIPAEAIQYKFAGGSWSDNWGGPGGTGVPNGANIAATIEATGIHRFTFDQVLLAYAMTRPAFADAAAFLAAYGLSGDPGGDADGDGLTNAAEFTGNSDPGNPDTDGDGTTDNTDPNPLGPGTAYDTWIAASGVPPESQAHDADPDTDGRPNVAEFLFGGNPLSGSDPATVVSAAGTNTVIEWLGRTSPAQATYVVETNPLLASGWSALPNVPAASANQAGVPPGYTRLAVSIPRGGGSAFYHVKGTME